MKSNVIKVNRLSQQSNRNTSTHVSQRVGAYTSTDHKVDAVNQLIKDQLAPRIAQHSSNAILSDRESFYYYKRKSNGRRCSCFGEESNPDSDCRICYGTGLVGGYDKYGTAMEIVDYTKPYLIAVNTDFDFENRAIGITGQAGSYIETEIDLPKNSKSVDSYFLGVDKAAAFKVEVVEPSHKVIKVASDLEAFLGNKFTIRVSFIKPGYFKFLMIRTKILDDILIHADLANNSDAPQLEAFGEFEALEEIPIVFAGGFNKYIGNKDILYRLRDGARLKITSHTTNYVSGVLTSVETNARFLISMDKIEKTLII